MTSRAKAKAAGTASSSTADQGKAAQETAQDAEQPPCGAVHHLPLLAHVTCQRPAGHPDEQPQGPDQGKHRARVAGALYVW